MDNVIWVEPKIACRVSYARKGKKGGLFDTKLVAILGEIDIATGDDAPAEEILLTNDR